MEKYIAAILLFALALFVLSGCQRTPGAEPEKISGGTTDRSDPDAPKTIRSKDIAELSAAFTLATRWKTEREDNDFRFVIKPDESGALTASEELLGVSGAADAVLLTALQEIIDRYDLAALNGVDRVTAGLAPGYQEGGLTVRYASGEMLTFRTNNDPFAAWAEAFYDTFASWFAERGDDSLYPKETARVVSFRLDVTEGDSVLRYGAVNVDAAKAVDGETRLLRRSEHGNGGEDKYVPFPADYGERVTAILAKHETARKYEFSAYDRAEGNFGNHDAGYFGMGSMTTADGEPDSQTLWVLLNADYEDGFKLRIDTRKASEIEGMRALLSELAAYHDSLF